MRSKWECAPSQRAELTQWPTPALPAALSRDVRASVRCRKRWAQRVRAVRSRPPARSSPHSGSSGSSECRSPRRICRACRGSLRSSLGSTTSRSPGTSLWVSEEARYGEASYRQVAELAREANRADTQALVLSCTNLPTYDLIAPLERELRKPVISANQATMWAALRSIGRRAVGPDQQLIERF